MSVKSLLPFPQHPFISFALAPQDLLSFHLWVDSERPYFNNSMTTISFPSVPHCLHYQMYWKCTSDFSHRYLVSTLSMRKWRRRSIGVTWVTSLGSNKPRVTSNTMILLFLVSSISHKFMCEAHQKKRPEENVVSRLKTLHAWLSSTQYWSEAWSQTWVYVQPRLLSAMSLWIGCLVSLSLSFPYL